MNPHVLAIHQLKANLASEEPEIRARACRLLDLTTDNLSVIDVMGSAPGCARYGCQAKQEASELIATLESYDFTCEGGPLKNCREWIQLKTRLTLEGR